MSAQTPADAPMFASGLEVVDDVLRLLMRNSWRVDAAVEQPAIRVFYQALEVTADTTAALLPADPGIAAVGWVEMIDRERLVGFPRIVRRYGLVRWEKKP